MIRMKRWWRRKSMIVMMISMRTKGGKRFVGGNAKLKEGGGEKWK